MKNNQSSRRSFFKTSALGALGTITVPTIITGCSGSESKKEQFVVNANEIFMKAPAGRPLKAGLVGCGGRGTGAAQDFLAAGDGLQITALGDAFQDRLDSCRAILKEKGHEIADKNCFVGLDNCQKVTDSGVDIVLLCNPPIFRPNDFEYVIEKGKHCFMEKPAATCPAGIRKILVAHRKSVQQGLSVTTGTALRSSQSHIETYRRVAEGAIGRIVSAHMSRMGGALWFRQRERGWSDMDYLLRNWVSFCRASGDFFVEQMVHHVDQLLWFTNEMLPIRAEANGGRQRRQTGDQYDHFSVEYVYENGMRAHCTSRQINGCSNKQQYVIYGTKGYTDAESTIWNYDNEVVWKFESPKRDDPDRPPVHTVQEHIRLVNAIRTGKPVHEAESLAHSTLMAIMGRESAYTGKFVTWDEIMASDQNYMLDKLEFGPIPWLKEEIPLAGVPSNPRTS